GREVVDPLGLETKLLELVALGLLLTRASGWLKPAIGLASGTFLMGTLMWVSVARSGGLQQHTHTSAVAEPPTYRQRVAAMDLATATRVGTARFSDVSAALAAGYRPTTPPNTFTMHYENKTYERDGDVFNPERPQGLVYVGPRLVGALYIMPRLGVDGP